MSPRVEDWDELGMTSFNPKELELLERMSNIGDDYSKLGVHWHIMMKSVLNDYWMDTGYRQQGDISEFDNARMDVFISKIYYCWVQMWKCQHPDDFKRDENGMVE